MGPEYWPAPMSPWQPGSRGPQMEPGRALGSKIRRVFRGCLLSGGLSLQTLSHSCSMSPGR